MRFATQPMSFISIADVSWAVRRTLAEARAHFGRGPKYCPGKPQPCNLGVGRGSAEPHECGRGQPWRPHNVNLYPMHRVGCWVLGNAAMRLRNEARSACDRDSFAKKSG